MNSWDIWEKAKESSNTCSGCLYGSVTRDPYSTGDSPMVVECTALRASQCPDVGEWEQFISDCYERGEVYAD